MSREFCLTLKYEFEEEEYIYDTTVNFEWVVDYVVNIGVDTLIDELNLPDEIEPHISHEMRKEDRARKFVDYMEEMYYKNGKIIYEKFAELLEEDDNIKDEFESDAYDKWLEEVVENGDESDNPLHSGWLSSSSAKYQELCEIWKSRSQRKN